MSVTLPTRWLEDEPRTWHDVNRALQDVSILLQYLGQLPEARLPAYFDDTKGRLIGDGLKNAVPPTPCYAEFLNRLFEIANDFRAGHPPPAEARAAPAAGQCPPLGPIGFVFWSRDFLAAVAAPATASSIRLTRDFIVHRARPGPLRRLSGRVYAIGQTLPTRSAHIPELPTIPEEEVIRKMLARRLARWATCFERLTILAVAVTVMISIYALSGRLILDSQRDTAETWAKLDAQIEAQEDKIFPAAMLPFGEKTQLIVVGLCDFVTTRSAAAIQGVGQSGAQIRPIATGDAPGESKPLKAYLSARQEHLCDDRAKALLGLFVASLHLRSWSSVVTQRIGEGFAIPLPFAVNAAIPIRLPVGPLFGVLSEKMAASAQEANGNLCTGIAPDAYKTGDGTKKCEQILWNLINQSRNLAVSVLGSITQYILPVLYGFLGAMAAALRLLRRKTAASLLNSTDRAALVQGAILGVLCGSVIGLFASYFGTADATAGLGVSAFALLAGYNVDGVFRFLDELSDRLFRPNPAPKSGQPVS